MQWWWVKAEKPRGVAPPTPSRLARRGGTTLSRRATPPAPRLSGPHLYTFQVDDNCTRIKIA